MHGLQITESDLDFLKGAMLTQVCIGQNDMILWFDNNASITVMSEVACIFPTDSSVKFSDFSRGASVICGLLGRAVSRLTISDSGRQLVLEFEETTLAIVDNSDEFESFTIAFSGKTYVT